MHIVLLLILMILTLGTIFFGLLVQNKKLSNKMMIFRVILQALVIALLFFTFA
ncbi:MAG: HIG1 domain-containing protein [Rickettsiaceae bacterium H1]|nr:HIG1 domain-containing protein [Rickettsiaceae bacterium H1]